MSRNPRVRAARQRALDEKYDATTVDRLVAEVEEAVASGRGSVTFPRRGRPSLTGDKEPSPSVGFRLTPQMRLRAQEVAAREGLTVSELARKALESYLQKAG